MQNRTSVLSMICRDESRRRHSAGVFWDVIEWEHDTVPCRDAGMCRNSKRAPATVPCAFWDTPLALPPCISAPPEIAISPVSCNFRVRLEFSRDRGEAFCTFSPGVSVWFVALSGSMEWVVSVEKSMQFDFRLKCQIR